MVTKQALDIWLLLLGNNQNCAAATMLDDRAVQLHITKSGWAEAAGRD
jgi:hypothetical protein